MPIDPAIPLSVQPPKVDIIGSMAKAQQLQAGQQQLEMGDIQTAQAGQAFKDQQMLRSLYGQAGGDLDKMVSLAAGKVGPKALLDLQNAAIERKYKLSQIADNDLKVAQAHSSMIADKSLGILNAPAEKRPMLYQQAISDLAKNGIMSPQELQSLPRDQAGNLTYPGDDWIQIHAHSKDVFDQEMKRREDTRAAAADTRAAAGEQRAAELQPLKVQEAQGNVAKTAAELPGIRAKSTIEKASADALQSMTPADWQKALDDTIPDKQGTLYRRTNGAMRLALSRGDLKAAQAAIKDAGDQLGRTETAVATAKATAPIKIEVAAAGQVARADAAGLTEDDYKRAGEQYGRTGVMPAMGRDSITRGRIEHAKNEWARDNGLNPADLVALQAAYAGDKESLKKFQANRDQIVSFESTAKKNLDLFLNAAEKIPDTGSPWLNTPLRKVDDKLLGSEELAAVNAARQVANNEIAKVTSGGGLSGVLSDSARHEVSDYNPQNATFKQTMAVAKILKQDMANRHSSMDAQLEDIKGRLGGRRENSDQAPALPSSLTQADVGKVYTNRAGKRLKITAVNPSNPKQFQSQEVQ